MGKIRIYLGFKAIQIIFLFVIAIIDSPILLGQTIEDFRTRWKNEQKSLSIEGQETSPFLQSLFYEFAQARDDEFAEYLSEPWKTFIITPGTIFPKSVSPKNQPEFLIDIERQGPPRQMSFIVPDQDWMQGPNDILITPLVQKTGRESKDLLNCTYSFYGNNVTIGYSSLLASSNAVSVNEGSTALFWQIFTKANGNFVTDQLMDYRDQLGLDDWGYFLLAKKCASAIYPGNPHAAKMLAWSLMLRSGYHVRIGYTRSNPVILFSSSSVIYSQPYITIDQLKYYLDENIAGVQITTYMNDHPAAKRWMDLTFRRSLNFNISLISRKFPFDWGRKHYEFTFKINEELIRFYQERPKTDARLAFEAPVSAQLKDDIFKQFYPVVSRMGKPEATAFLQQFVQKAFEYRSYNDLYGHDKFLFPEEMFACDGSNDKGRVALFSWLVRNLLKLPVAVLEFPSYYSLAIAYNENIDGDFYQWEGLKYTIADPTYQDAPIGLIMPGYLNVKPKLFPLTNYQSISDKNRAIWSHSASLGAKRAGFSRDLITDKEGNTYLVGYFENPVQGEPDRSYPFIACYSKNNSLKWIRKFSSNNRSFGFALEKQGEDEIYLAGSFRGTLEMGGLKLETYQSRPDLFFAQFNREGEIVWLKKVGIDSLEMDANLSYLAKFDRSGNNLSLQLMNEDERNVQSGFFGADRNWLYFIGSRNWTTGIARISNDKSGITDLFQTFRQERNILIAGKCESTISGFASILRLLSIPGTELNGVQLQSLITSVNPNFNSSNPVLFSAIGQIEKVRNKDGLISITNVGKSVVSIDHLRIENKARFMLAETGNKDLMIRVISGIDYADIHFKSSLNSVLVDISSGNLILDYDHDHTLRTVNYRRNVLKLK
jgi:hypothetical protein